MNTDPSTPSAAVIRSVIEELRALGQEWRMEFPDGRVCKAELNRIADRLETRYPDA
jgi:hypothetical protein